MMTDTLSLGAAEFRAWAMERGELGETLARTPESEAQIRESLLDRSYQLERLIIETPSDELSAIRAKAAILLWHMDMERADGLPAMRHIRTFLDQLS